MDVLDAAVAAATVVLPLDHRSPAARYALVLDRPADLLVVRERAEAALATFGAVVSPLSELEPGVLVVTLPGRAFAGDPAAVFASAYALGDVLGLGSVEPDLPTGFPDDGTDVPGPLVGEERSGGLPPGCQAPAEPHLEDLWALEEIRVPQAWAFSEFLGRPNRGEGIVVAQPDTGVTAHAELTGASIVAGRDLVSGDDDPTDPLDDGGNPGHGTGTASVLISPSTHRVTGSAPRARLMPIRAVRSVVQVSQVSVAQAIDWATGHGASVITLSLGGLPSETLLRALRRAVAADVVVLAAAGNCVRLVVFPARYEDCVAVAGSNAAGAPWRGTCRGAAVDVAAPAQNVLRAEPGVGTVGHGQGTSFAVALTAGVAALWLAHHGRGTVQAAARARGETVQALFTRLLRAAARRPAGWDTSEFGAGIVDARALLAADLELPLDREAPARPANPARAAVEAMRSLVAEAVGREAAEEPLDWRRFGPEVVAELLRQRAATEDARFAPPPLSPRLVAALASAPVLRSALRVDGPVDPDPHLPGTPATTGGVR